jgi:hypothetical protein
MTPRDLENIKAGTAARVLKLIYGIGTYGSFS